MGTRALCITLVTLVAVGCNDQTVVLDKSAATPPVAEAPSDQKLIPLNGTTGTVTPKATESLADPHTRPKTGAIHPKPMLPVEALPGERGGAKADQFDDYKLANPNVYNITAAPSSPMIAAAEWDTKQALTISWTGSFPDVYADIVSNSNPVTDVWVIHQGSTGLSNFQQSMAAYGVSTAGVNYLNRNNDSIWIRDFGPISAFDADTNKTLLIDPRYYHQRVYDDAIPYHLANQWGLDDFRMPVDFEGGTFMADGRGTCFISQGVLWYNGVGEQTIRNYFRDYLGCYQLVILNPLQNEGTTHIDMFTKMADETTVILGEYQSFQDSTNAQLMNQNEAIYNSVVLAGGQAINVVRMPMPNNDGQSVWRTYVNSQFINGVNMIPVYTDNTTYESQALAIWDSVMPTWNHVALDATQLITWSGAIHCILMEVQAGDWSSNQSAPAQLCNNFSCYPSSNGSGGNVGCGGTLVSGDCNAGTASWCDFGTVQTQTCGAGESCAWDPVAGHYGCVDGSGCTPDCVGKACGNDGCGGSCGSCADGLSCSGNQCVADNPSDGDPCGDYSFEGCCNGSTLIYCAGQGLDVVNCGAQGCGWDAGNNFYNCNASGEDPSGTNPLQCPASCQPDCSGKDCGPDGCGGTCGTCASGDTCNASGTCDSGGCTPSCGTNACGPDGCGGSCGSCPSGQTCNGGTCEAVCVPDCAGKDCGSDGCGGTCGSCFGGATCDANGQCVSDCTPDCTNLECGDDGCGGSCGSCGAGEICTSGLCEAVGSGCGDIAWEGVCDYSTGSMTWCEDGQLQTQACNSGCCGWTGEDNGNWCWSAQNCGFCVNECDSGTSGCSNFGTHSWTCAEPTANFPCRQRIFSDCPGGCDETTGACVTCTPDCSGKSCGDDGCGGSCGTCPPGEQCSVITGSCEPEACVPDCSGKVCGDDGCGGICGGCAADEECNAGQCVPGTCVPQCDGKTCGPDGCSGSCGECPAGDFCNATGQCVTLCVPDCDGKTCGTDGCGGSCGECAAGQFCDAGVCTDSCTPVCDGKSCGDDGCGSSCGVCADGQICTDAGQCVDECTPDCDGKVCGLDGCGGSCGACAAGEECDATGQCAAITGCGDVSFEGECQGTVVTWCEAGSLNSFDCADENKVCGFTEGLGFTCVADSTCIPQCDGKACGDDACGGSCGSCADGELCNASGQCEAETECGTVTYEGECQGDTVVWCDNGTLKTYDCTTQNKTCGFQAPAGYTCVDNVCDPDCTNKQCGDDGCGGSCGTCGDDQVCLGSECVDQTPPTPDEGPSEDTGGTPDEGTTEPDATVSGDATTTQPDTGVPVNPATPGDTEGCASGASGGGNSLPVALLALFGLAVVVLRRRRLNA